MNDYPRKVPSKKSKKQRRGQDGTSRVKKQDTAPKYCEIPDCHYDRIVQIHRIHPGKERNKLWPSGGTYVLGNAIRLCPTHHAEADRGIRPRKELWDIVQKRIDQDGQRHLQDVRTLPEIRLLPPEEARLACERKAKAATERSRERVARSPEQRDLPSEEL